MSQRHSRPIAVMVVVDDQITRLGLRVLLRNMACVREVFEAKGRYDALKFAAAVDLGLVVVVEMNRGSAPGTDAVIDDLAALRADATFVIYSDDVAAAVGHCRGKGVACSYASRGPTSAAELARTIQVLAPGHGPVDAAAPWDCGHREAGLLSRLSVREREVLSLVASGWPSKGIAQYLGVSLRTVESHRSSICTKVGVRTVAGLTKVAVKAGLASLDEPAHNSTPLGPAVARAANFPRSN